MQKSEDVVIHMRRSLDREVINSIVYLVGDADVLNAMADVPAKPLFDWEVLEFLNDLSKTLMKDSQSRNFSDVVTFAFWIRMASTKRMQEQYGKKDKNIHLGRGSAFHIAPSNVPVNFAYSLVAGLLTGNSNVVRVPSKTFPQVSIIVDGIKKTLRYHKQMRQYIILIRYERSKAINDFLSMLSDIRIVWGGDATISELRKSPLPARSLEITFADRYSLAVINAEAYLTVKDKATVAENFYNDTYFSDQNACTSPRIVIWTGKKKSEAKKLFWRKLHEVVEKKYHFQSIQGVNKLTSGYLLAANLPGTKIIQHGDNTVTGVSIPEITEYLMDLKDNSGYFFEYDCNDIHALKTLCDDRRCQTIGFLGDKEELLPLLTSGIHGVDRVVPIGKTMDFDLIWDGYDLVSQMSRTIKI